MRKHGALTIAEMVQREIDQHDRPENRVNYQQFFKETLKEPTGLRTSVLRKISNQCYKEVKNEPKNVILDYCEAFLKSDMRYGRFLAFEWALKVKSDYAVSDFARFERWLNEHVSNWGACDHLCGGPIGNLILKNPGLVRRTKRWRKSRNRWVRRASAVSLILPVRHRVLLDEVFQTADCLLTDHDDMVQKGYGWMLKEAGNIFPSEVFAFVLTRKDRMPRTALRYAIEKYPAAKRKQAMKRD
jgi:3-methyladenine DNA glycosylase AlkD